MPFQPKPHLPIALYSQQQQGEAWIEAFISKPALLACVFGFTETGLLPGISAAGATPTDRRYTALADAEFLAQGLADRPPRYPLPPLQGGISPTLITRALWERYSWPCFLFNAGLPLAPSVPLLDLGGQAARCLSTGHALDRAVVDRLWRLGQTWGQNLAAAVPGGYSIIGECVVGGTTTALALLTGLGVAARGRVNSSHAACNHEQKAKVVSQGLRAAQWPNSQENGKSNPGQVQPPLPHPLDLVAAVGDPMQVVVAGIALSASRYGGVILAGGTQMLAVYALAIALAEAEGLEWSPERIIVGTTRWVAEDPTGDTPGLAAAIGDRWGTALTPCLMATQLSFAPSRFPQLRLYEQGFVKEGVAAGGSAIAATLTSSATQADLLATIEAFVDRYQHWQTALNLYPSP
ncbi:MAG: nicotinate mononucleotide-dependent phosphoribosyltransferase CobT [Prochlorothrix sp.]